ncbi:MAG: [FeFe] hydrogenase H-cluster maturation GTPase HydF [Ruminococcus sp.]|uniref:[FeFe] hydrogenase H-cluster maturation GTPase HydF n=1 Tax=Ruminococcus sp. TaxID=41978 RepID=UPI0025E1CCA4|nr:[FeFe] hydrogenase H-cluster maturation GTPase HydF [Ruminococcus sp.]MBO4867986.1 [FeFe] hydrogenase H-cluster maturation GTPase HydF [Ruminococcus sp.]
MGLNDTPSGERVHIGFFGRRNAGKSSVVNAFTNQELAIVSDTPGTTTDPVYKAMELLPMGPVMIIDTPGYDDEGALGELRVKKTSEVLNKTDCAVLVTDCTRDLDESEKQLIKLFEGRRIPYVIAKNKSDLLDSIPAEDKNEIYVSALNKTMIHELREKVAQLTDYKEQSVPLVGDLIGEGELAVLCIPIDKAAPKGRLILPQQQVIRDLLEHGSAALTCRETELKGFLEQLNPKPAVVITDSQVFAKANEATPADIKLTSFSIIMARYKGFLEPAVRGAKAIDSLKDGDRILISEGCTHHRQCEDIGTVKLPKLLKKYTGKDFKLEFSSGREFPDDLTDYALVIHCGGCMLNAREMSSRMMTVEEAGVPVTNYGIAIAYMNGILKRSLEIIPEIK